jgi:amidase
MNNLLSLSGTRQAELIRAGEASSVELIEAHLARIDEINPVLNAVVEVLREPALREAEAVDRRRAAGEVLRPLEGVPFSIKDSIEVKDTICSAGTLGLRHAARSTGDATLVARLRGAGAIPIARTNLPDLLFAFESDNLIFGRTNNPYDHARTSGGSSGGEAALIAACGSPFGLGSDAAGSVRLPAHYCGIASLKPTSGRLARTGHVPAAGGWLEMVWQIGPMARRVEDLWTMMPILLGEDGYDRTVVAMPYGDPGDVPLRRLRLAFFTDNGIVPADADTDEVVRASAKALAGAVLSAEECRPSAVDQSYDLEMKMTGPDGGDGLREYLESIGSNCTHRLLDGWLEKLEPYRTDLAGFTEYWKSLDKFRKTMYAFGQRYDAILSPVSSQPAVPHGMSIDDTVFRGFSYTMTHNLTGWPAAVVRGGTSRSGLPIGVQIAANPWREDVALALAKVLERSFPEISSRESSSRPAQRESAGHDALYERR